MNTPNDGVAGQYNRMPSPSQQGYAGAPQQPLQSDVPMNPNSSGGTAGNTYVPYRPNIDLPRAESPPPLPEPTESAVSSVANAIEMDATPAAGASSNNGQFGNLRDSDTDVAGMVDLQQGQQPLSTQRDTFASDGSRYSQDEYVLSCVFPITHAVHLVANQLGRPSRQYAPSRAQWNPEAGRNSPRVPVANTSRGPTPNMSGTTAPVVDAKGKGEYYEDVDPRFDQTVHTPPRRQTPPPPLQLNAVDYEDMRGPASGTRSPAESEHSNFTSISQRGINPQWSPQPPVPQRRPVQQRHDMILDNPDFKLPGGRATAAGKRRGPGMMP